MDRVDSLYFEQANRWDRDRERLLSASNRRAWAVACAASGLAVLLGSALALLTPLKRTEPYLVRVDSTTGVVDMVPRYAGTADLPETVTRHLVTDYVTSRERYVPALAEADYEQVGAYQTAALNQAWAAAWMRTNADSPLNRYAPDDRVTVRVRSISFLRRDKVNGDLIQVRLTRSTTRGGGGEEKLDHYVATMITQFGSPADDLRRRALNPLGFKVLEYRREPEDVERAAPREPDPARGLP